MKSITGMVSCNEIETLGSIKADFNINNTQSFSEEDTEDESADEEESSDDTVAEEEDDSG